MKLDVDEISYSDARQCILKILICRPLDEMFNINTISTHHFQKYTVNKTEAHA